MSRKRENKTKEAPAPMVVLPPIERTAEGLRDCLFDEIDQLRAGTVTTAHARALANLVRQVIDAARLELQHRQALEARSGKSLLLGSEKNG